ncbi:hypothetical protein FOZ60_007122 [Perkinsus olseni]|uniref:Tyr recombinase domain-containing protein n=1 Tax=Perkinsus olseni TaxID=32597 RepID=A0A7J6NPC8_PEROL|nr:hypothetical protein FOZ60_007122 [Perkinsus olseni]
MPPPAWVVELLHDKRRVYEMRRCRWDASRTPGLYDKSSPYQSYRNQQLPANAGGTLHFQSIVSDQTQVCNRDCCHGEKALQPVAACQSRRYGEEDAILLLAHSRAASTNASYDSVRRGYERFVANNQDRYSACDPFPIDLLMLAKYAAYLVDVMCERPEKPYKTSTILQYIRVLLTLNKMHPRARPFTVQEAEILRMVRAATVRVRGKTPVKRACTMTATQLRRISYTVPPSGRRPSTVALLLGVSALLRIREVAELRRDDVKFAPNGTSLRIRIKWSKTDPGRAGSLLHVGCACSPATTLRRRSYPRCPIHRLKQLLYDADDPAPYGPLFKATYDQLCDDIKALVSLATGLQEGCTTQSMRRTGVVLLHDAGFDDVQIAEYGRWVDTRMVREIYRRNRTGLEEEQATYAERMM